MAMRATAATAEPSYRAGAVALALAAGGILAALGFEHIGGYDPCPLCLMQRWAYYACLPLLFVALMQLTMGRRGMAVVLFALVAVAFLANAGLGIYHVGVEEKLWLGPDSCAVVMRPIGGGSGGILDRLPTTRVARCDEAPWRLLGLSFAGWNVVVSALASLAAAQAAWATPRR